MALTHRFNRGRFDKVQVRKKDSALMIEEERGTPKNNGQLQERIEKLERFATMGENTIT